MLAVGSSLATLVAARLLHGTSSGVVYTVGPALLVDTVGSDEARAWTDFALSDMSIGLIAGPFLRGIIYAKARYHGVFAVLFGIAAVDFVLRLFMIEKRTAAAWIEISNNESNHGTFSNSLNSNGEPDAIVPKDNQEPFGSARIISSRPVEDDTSEPMRHEPGSTSTVDLKRSRLARRLQEGLVACFLTMYALLNSPKVAAELYGAFINISLLSSFDGILSLFVQKTFGWGSAGAGVIFLAISIPSPGAPIVGALSDRPRYPRGRPWRVCSLRACFGATGFC